MKIAALMIAALAMAACQSDTKGLEKKIDDLNAKVDRLLKGGGAGAGAQRPQRPEPDRAKTYAVGIEGDPIIGPANAKITLIEAFDYA
jgi:outer membrane murein-binding lipoprotein Lpp